MAFGPPMPTGTPLDSLIDEIRRSLPLKIPLLTLAGTLTVPDICSALASSNGETNGDGYQAWVSTNLPRGSMWAEDLWHLRCAILHQGRTQQRPADNPRRRVAITFEGSQIHRNVTRGEAEVAWFSVGLLASEITSAAEHWYARHCNEPNVIRNMASLARIQEGGTIGGIPGGRTYPHRVIISAP